MIGVLFYFLPVPLGGSIFKLATLEMTNENCKRKKAHQNNTCLTCVLTETGFRIPNDELLMKKIKNHQVKKPIKSGAGGFFLNPNLNGLTKLIELVENSFRIM